ncbi:MAG: viroplasmin family protein [Wujia sp.]
MINLYYNRFVCDFGIDYRKVSGMAKKYYAVKNGLKPGVYDTWEECALLVKGYPGAIYKSFPTRKEAEEFAGVSFDASEEAMDVTKIADVPTEPYAFVDGSYNSATGVYGYGGFLVEGGMRHVIKGSGNDEEMAAMRNVAGEVLGAIEAVRLAIQMGLPKLYLYYDYLGIEMWATGKWKRNKTGTIAYYDYMQSVKNQIEIVFVKVKGHSGVEGNEEADRIAKESVGIS